MKIWYIILMLFVISINSWSKDQVVRCELNFIPDQFESELFFSTFDLDGYKKDFKVFWKHDKANQIDSFMVYKQNDTYWTHLYIRNQDSKHLYTGKAATPRGIAYHHLRERIFNTALRWEDLDLLARNDFSCPLDEIIMYKQEYSDSGQGDSESESMNSSDEIEETIASYSKIIPNKSAIWWSGGYYPAYENQKPDSLALRGSYGVRNVWKFFDYEKFNEKFVPTKIELHSDEKVMVKKIIWHKSIPQITFSDDIFQYNKFNQE